MKFKVIADPEAVRLWDFDIRYYDIDLSFIKVKEVNRGDFIRTTYGYFEVFRVIRKSGETYPANNKTDKPLEIFDDDECHLLANNDTVGNLNAVFGQIPIKV